MTDVEQPDKTGKRLSKKQRTVIIVTASVAAVALIVGISAGVTNHNRAVAAQQAQAAKVAKARAACDKSIDRLVRAQDALAAKKNDKTVAAALKIKASDVKDGKTVEALAEAVKDGSKAASCKVDDVKALDAAAKKNDRTAATLTAQAGKVSAAAKSVTDSQAAKRADDKAKADAAAQAAAQQAQQAQAAQQSQSSGSTGSSTGSYSGRTYRYSTTGNYGNTGTHRSGGTVDGNNGGSTGGSTGSTGRSSSSAGNSNIHGSGQCYSDGYCDWTSDQGTPIDLG